MQETKLWEPQEVSDADVTFGDNVMGLLPAMNEIPQDFHHIVGIGETKWNRLVADWFYDGLKNVKWVPKDGIETRKAIRHVVAIMRSYTPKHEHKMAGCAYLLSLWFDDITYDRQQ